MKWPWSKNPKTEAEWTVADQIAHSLTHHPEKWKANDNYGIYNLDSGIQISMAYERVHRLQVKIPITGSEWRKIANAVRKWAAISLATADGDLVELEKA